MSQGIWSQRECVSPVEIAGKQLPADRQSLRYFFYFQFWFSCPFETHTRILHLLRATNVKKAILVLQSSEWIQHIATALTKAITSHKIYFLFWGPGSQTGYFLPFTYLIRSCCSSGFLDCLYLSEISFHISPVSATLSRLPVIKCKKQNTCPIIQLLWWWHTNLH